LTASRRSFTDANSYYRLAFERHGMPEPHEQTHLIEAANSSIRDNLARFTRRPNRCSKSMQCSTQLSTSSSTGNTRKTVDSK
jgi:IS1 family transposase